MPDVDVPAAYYQFTVERAFWETLGWTAEDFRKKPRKQVADYMKIMQILDHHQAEEIERAKNKGR